MTTVSGTAHEAVNLSGVFAFDVIFWSPAIREKQEDVLFMFVCGRYVWSF